MSCHNVIYINLLSCNSERSWIIRFCSIVPNVTKVVYLICTWNTTIFNFMFIGKELIKHLAKYNRAYKWKLNIVYIPSITNKPMWWRKQRYLLDSMKCLCRSYLIEYGFFLLFPLHFLDDDKHWINVLKCLWRMRPIYHKK